MTEKARGGYRPGAGRKKGQTIVKEVRKNRTLKATDEEWQIILEFARNLKKAPEQFGQ